MLKHLEHIIIIYRLVETRSITEKVERSCTPDLITNDSIVEINMANDKFDSNINFTLMQHRLVEEL